MLTWSMYSEYLKDTESIVEFLLFSHQQRHTMLFWLPLHTNFSSTKIALTGGKEVQVQAKKQFQKP